MEDENIFSEEEQNIFGESFFRISSENFRKESQMVLEAESFEQEAPELYQEKERKFKAHNPLDRLSSLPQDQRKEYEFMMNNHKTFNGIQYFFEIGEEKMHSE